MTSNRPVLCASCVRWDVEEDSCEAFPEGVPLLIALGADHRRPIAGDRGIQYKQAEGAEAKRELANWKAMFGPDGRIPAVTPA